MADEEVLRHLSGTDAKIEELRTTLERKADEARRAAQGAAASAQAASAQAAAGGGPGGAGARGAVGARARGRRMAAAAAAAAAFGGAGFGGWGLKWRTGDSEASLAGAADGSEPSGDAGFSNAGAAALPSLAGLASGAPSAAGLGGGAAEGSRWEGLRRYVMANIAHWQAHKRDAERFKEMPRALGW